jgi:hypothetical protein
MLPNLAERIAAPTAKLTTGQCVMGPIWQLRLDTAECEAAAAAL